MIDLASKEERQAENVRKMLLAMIDDIRVVLIKLADRLHNMRTLAALPEERQKKIAQETLEIYAPLAHRLGMSKVRGELEDLAFRYTDPIGYKQIHDAVEARRKNGEHFLQQVEAVIREKLKENGIEARVERRIKRNWSIYQKLQRQRITVDQVYDFLAIRIVAKEVKDCYGALGAIHNLWRPVAGRIKDFIAMPRPNLYQSLHTTVIAENGTPFEVQIRTEEMHHMCEDGIAAHWKYKDGVPVTAKDEERLAWLRQVVEWQKDVKDPGEFLSGFKHWLNLHQRERAIEIGRKLVEREAKKYRLSVKSLDEDGMQKVAADYGFGRPEDLFAAIGYGKFSARSMLAKLLPASQPDAAAPAEKEEDGGISSVVRRVFGSSADSAALKVRGHDDLLTYRARCCTPSRGEEIIGYVTRGKGVPVHSLSCRNVRNLMYEPDRSIAVEWAKLDK